MYYGGGTKTQVNNDSQPLTSDFVSLALKGRTDGFTLVSSPAICHLLAIYGLFPQIACDCRREATQPRASWRPSMTARDRTEE
jgi:hypothetical protein